MGIAFRTTFRMQDHHSNTGSLGRSNSRPPLNRCTTPDTAAQVALQFDGHHDYPDSADCFENLVYQYNTGTKDMRVKQKIREQLPENCFRLNHMKAKSLHRGSAVADNFPRFRGRSLYPLEYLHIVDHYGTHEDRLEAGRALMLTENIVKNSCKNLGVTSVSTRSDVSVRYAESKSNETDAQPIMIDLVVDPVDVPKGYISRFNGLVKVDGKSTFKDELLVDPTNKFELLSYRDDSDEYGMPVARILMSHD